MVSSHDAPTLATEQLGGPVPRVSEEGVQDAALAGRLGVGCALLAFLVSGTALSSTADHKDVENVRNEFIDWHISKTAYDPKDRATLRGIKVPPPPKRWRGES